MDRRDFIKKASAGALALSLPQIPDLLQGTPMGIVVHSYASRWQSPAGSARYPGFGNALDLMTHCHRIGAGGVQVLVKGWSADFAKKVRDQREKLGLYLEGSIALPKDAAGLPAFEQEVRHAGEAGAQVLRTVCSSGRRYETYPSAAAFRQAQAKALASLQLAEPVLRKHKIKLAVENHKDWRARELATMLQQLSSEWIGVTLDFGNSISLLEDPMEVVGTLAPYVFSTHVKDMGLDEYADGFLLAELPLGQGMLDLPAMVALCRQHNPAISFNLEMITRDPLQVPCLTQGYWATFEEVPGTDLARTLQLVRRHKASRPLPRVSQLQAEERLAVEENNILLCLAHSKDKLGIK